MKNNALFRCLAAMFAISFLLSGCATEKDIDQVKEETQQISVAFYYLLPGSEKFKEVLL